MSSLSGSSPDPLHLPSSPISAHTFTRRRSVAPPTHSHFSGTPGPRHSSPSKSFLMDAGDARLKITVQSLQSSASQSPSKRPSSRTTTIPLRTGESSPAVAKRKRQPTPAAHIDESDIFRRSLRKRKGTPVESSRHSARNQRAFLESAVEEEEEEGGMMGEYDAPHIFQPEPEPARETRAASAAMFSEQSVPSSEVRRRRSLYPMRNQRYKRLSAAREELDEALQDAISEREGWYSDALHSERGGELTVANEDFTMITGESLASIKASTTMLSTHDEGERSHVDDGAEHLTSSPPKIDYPDLTEQAKEAETPLIGGDQDAISWKPTGPAVSRIGLGRSEDREDQDDREEDGNEEYDEDSTEEEDAEEAEDAQDVQQEKLNLVLEQALSSSNKKRHSLHAKSATPRPSSRAIERAAALDTEDPAAEHEYASEGDGEPEPEQQDDDDDDGDDDIWAEEASREIEESAASHRPLHSTTVSIPPIFDEAPTTFNTAQPAPISVPSTSAEEPNRPTRRARLPRTWRQNNGVDSSYTDSTGLSNRDQTTLEQPQQENLARTGSGDDAESGRSSGVLTPPSTDDDESRHKAAVFQEEPIIKQEPVADEEVEMFDDGVEREDQPMMEEEAEQQDDEHDDEDEEGDISGFTNPNAADTQLEAHHRFGHQDEFSEKPDDDVASTLSESQSNVSTPSESGEDTGFFWQTNLPSVYRRKEPKPQEKKPIDLSAILRMDSSKVEDTGSKAENRASQTARQSRPQARQPASRHSPLRMRPVFGKVNSTPSDNAAGRLLNTPLRKSLLRSSKVVNDMDSTQETSPAQNEEVQPVSGVEETQVTVTDDSFASKNSDQRQLLSEFKLGTPSPKKPATERLAVLRDDAIEQQSRSEDMNEDSFERPEPSNIWPEHSYEENLNIGSPQKINVNFNDSTLSYQQQQEQQQPSILSPKRPVRPLFDKSVNAPVLKAPLATTHKQPQVSSFLSNDATSASIQQENDHSTVLSRLNTTFWSAIARPQKPPPTPAPSARTTEQTISLSLRAALRSRYGVLPASHPWTMAHMRTLHRLLNSLASGRRDSIVPTHTHVPAYLEQCIGTNRQDATEQRAWRCERVHVYVVLAFMGLLVEPALYASMQKGEVDWLGDAQAAHLRGTMGGREGNEVCFKTVKGRNGLITWEWVLDCLGCCVISNWERGVGRGGHAYVGADADADADAGRRDVELSIMGDGEGDGRVKEWIERERSAVFP